MSKADEFLLLPRMLCFSFGLSLGSVTHSNDKKSVSDLLSVISVHGLK